MLLSLLVVVVVVPPPAAIVALIISLPIGVVVVVGRSVVGAIVASFGVTQPSLSHCGASLPNKPKNLWPNSLVAVHVFLLFPRGHEFKSQWCQFFSVVN